MIIIDIPLKHLKLNTIQNQTPPFLPAFSLPFTHAKVLGVNLDFSISPSLKIREKSFEHIRIQPLFTLLPPLLCPKSDTLPLGLWC